MEDETEKIASNEISRELNLQHTQGKTLTGFIYHDEEEKEKVGFVGIIGDNYYYLKQTKDKGEKWIKCEKEDISKFQTEIKEFSPHQNLL